MHIVGQVLHTVRKFFRIRNKEPILIPFTKRPAVINNKVFITGIKPALIHHKISHFTDQTIVDVLTESVPGVPSKGRS